MTVSRPYPSAPAQSSPAPPAWVTVAELLCLALVLIEAGVLVWGGFRVRFLGVLISFTSAPRVLLWLIVVAAVRYLGARDLPIQLPAFFARCWQPPGVRSAVRVLVGTRPAILFVGYLAVIMFGYVDGHAPYHVSSNEVVNLPMRWDAGWYMSIVTEGYGIEERNPGGQQNIVFFPAYPLTVRIVGDLLGGQLTSYMLAGVLVSFAAFFAALAYLYALARETLEDEDARYALWLVGAYPFAVFFGAIYSESMFLLAAVATFYHVRKGQFVRASCWGLLAGLTRAPGCFISIPLAILALEPWLPRAIVGGASDRPTPRHPVVKALAAAATPGLGMLAYSAFIWRLSGHPFAWASGHAAWGRHYQGLAVLFTDRYHYIANAGVTGYVSQLPSDMLNGLGALFVLAAVWPVARQLGLAYAVYILVNILPPLADGGLLSAGRFSSVLFPAFIWFGGAVPRAHRYGWIATFAAVQALVAALFYTWRPLY
jgi:hypothetical protein